MPLKLQSTVLTEAYVGGTSLNCLNAIHWYAKKCIGMVTWTVICPLYFSKYGQLLTLLRQRLKIILNSIIETMMMKIRSIISTRASRPEMMVLAGRVVESSFSCNGLAPQNIG